MLATKHDILFLRELSVTNELVWTESIPVSLNDEFNRFFFGKTLVKKDNKKYAYPHDVKEWIKYLFVKYNG